MTISRLPRIALVFMLRLEENVAILNAISTYNRFHEKWSAFIDDQAHAQKDPDWLLSKARWDGIICRHSAPALFDACVQQRIPVVDLSDDPHRTPGVPKIRPDNAAIGHSGAEHFLERGYRHFGFCGFQNEIWAAERRIGFVEALQLAGHDCHCLENEYPKVSTPGWEEQEESEIGKWLESLPKPIAIMACNDMRALQVINACRNHGLEVPGEVAVLGANNETCRCELSLPQLSSVPLNTEYYGQKAAQMITSLIHGQPIGEKEVFVEPLDVVTRRSTDFLSIDDPHVSAALKIIRERACKGVNVDEITREIHVSRSLLERRFRKFLGRSPQAEIRNLQIQRIKELLRETDYTLAHIAELVGFEHPEYMCVVFKKSTQLTPNRYRQRVQGKSD
ncbi:MAG: XylR family transcriptional regulator [Puniceicoccaceae bacterium]